MATLDPRKVVANLCKKGFKESTSHHMYYELWHDGKFILHTYVSHNGQEINDYLIGQMSKQCKLNKSDFKKFAKCTLTQEGYIKILKGEGHIEDSVDVKLEQGVD